MIKTKLTLLLLLFLSSETTLFSQTTNPGFAQWEALISRQINYPIEAIRARKEGIVAVSLSTANDGSLSEITLEKKASPYFDEQVLKAVESMRELWKADMLGEHTAGESYLMVFNFIIVQEGKTKESQLKSASTLIQKGKPDQALKIADRLVKENPYDAESLELRSQIYRQLGEEDKATIDLLAYQKIQEKVLTQIEIKVMQQVSTRQVSGSTSF